MFIGNDLKTTMDGKTVLKNGDFDLEENMDVAITNRMLRCSKGAWLYDPEISIGLQDYAGKLKNQATATEIEEAVINGLKRVGIEAQCTVFPVSFDSVNIVIGIITSEGSKTFEFSFTYKEGIVEYNRTQTDSSLFKTREAVNKYDRRRTNG